MVFAGASAVPAPVGTVTDATDCGKSSAYTATWDVQGDGDVSPLAGSTVSDVRGIVTAAFEKGSGGPYEPRGFFIQAHEPDCDDATSDGLFVYTGTNPLGASVGALVEIDGARVTEYQGPSWYRWDFTLTELLCSSGCALTVLDADRGAPAPAELDPPADAAAAHAYNEAREGMLVTVTGATTVVAPTNKFDEIVLVRGAGADRVTHANGGRTIMVDGDGVPASLCGADGLPDARTFDAVTGVVGPLNYNFNAFKVQQDPRRECLVLTEGDASSYDPAKNPPPASGPATLTVASVNALNLFDTVDDAHKSDPVVSASELDRRARGLADLVCHAEGLNRPDVVALQEVENLVVVEHVASAVATACGVDYAAFTHDAPDNRGIQVGYLARTDRVDVVSVTARQGCSATDWGIGYESGDDAPGVTCPPDKPHYLFNRPPLEMVLRATLAGETREVVLLNNHFKSKLPSSRCASNDCTDRRVAQAEHVRALVDARLAGDADARVVVLGDLNDHFVSDPLDVLTRDGALVNTWARVPGDEDGAQGAFGRYSHIFRGVSATLDHVLVTRALDALAPTFSPRHVNADWPHSLREGETRFGTSDHDPLVVAFTFTRPNEPPAAAFTWECTWLECAFDAGNTTDADGTIASYAWDFGDGGTAQGARVNHTFAQAGTFTVTLTVTDDDGATDALARDVTVEERPCTLPLPFYDALRLPQWLTCWAEGVLA